MAGRVLIIVVMAGSSTSRAAVLEGIRALTAGDAPLLETLERVLADGYACVHQVEHETQRLRRRLEQRAAALGDGSGAEQAREVGELARDIVEADAGLSELRDALLVLRETARRVRAA